MLHSHFKQENNTKKKNWNDSYEKWKKEYKLRELIDCIIIGFRG